MIYAEMVRPLEERAVLNVYADENLVLTGDVFEVREHIEALLEEKLGFFVTLTEYFETADKTYYVCLHTDAYEDLSDEELDQVFALDISESEDSSTDAIKSLFKLDFEFSHYLDK